MILKWTSSRVAIVSLTIIMLFSLTGCQTQVKKSTVSSGTVKVTKTDSAKHSTASSSSSTSSSTSNSNSNSSSSQSSDPNQQSDAVVNQSQVIKLSGTPQAQPTFTHVNFTSANDGWVTGEVNSYRDQANKAAVLWHTADGGKDWLRKSTPFSKIASLHISADGVGWVIATPVCSADASCHSFEIFRTTDGGNHWHLQWKAPQSDSKNSATGSPSLRMVDQDTAYAIASDLLLKTTNGGSDWATLPTNGWQPTHLYFTKKQTGWVSGQQKKQHNHPVLYKTVDGGSHWTKETVPQIKGGTTNILGMSFVTSSSGWILLSSLNTFSGAVYHTTDGGRHWVDISTVKTIRPYAEGLRFVDEKTGVIPLNAGAGPLVGGLLMTSDGGKHYNYRGINYGWSFNDAQMVTSQDGWAVGGLDHISYLLHTTDDGASWTQVMPVVRPHHDIQFVDQNYGFGAGTSAYDNEVLMTTDGGKTWTMRHRFPYYNRISSLSFIDDKHGWVSVRNNQTEDLVVYQTDDGGRTWQRAGQLPTLNVTTIRGHYLHFFNKQDGLIQLTDYPKFTFSVTHDGGADWSQPVMSMNKPMKTQDVVSFTGPNDGYLFLHANNQGINMLHISKGANWTRETTIPLPRASSDSGSGLYDVITAQMVSDQDGFVLTEHGSQPFQLWRTTDGGKTWTVRAFPHQFQTRSYHLAMTFTDKNHGWIQGDQGMLKTNDGGATWTWVK